MPQSTPKTPVDRWGIIKNWIDDNQADIVLIFGVILVAIIGFGLGRLTAPETVKKEPVVIENQGIENQKLEIGETARLSASAATGASQKSSALVKMTNSSTDKGLIVASKNGTKYHWPWCSWAKKIKLENQAWFNSEAEAQAAGYEPCNAFENQAPAGYKKP